VNDWVVETPSFEEDLMNNRMIMLNQKGVNEVVEIIKNKEKKIEELKRKLKQHEKCRRKQQQFYDKEIERLHSIIKEVREYIEENIRGNYFRRYDDEIYNVCDDIFEILDKENK